MSLLSIIPIARVGKWRRPAGTYPAVWTSKLLNGDKWVNNEKYFTELESSRGGRHRLISCESRSLKKSSRKVPLPQHRVHTLSGVSNHPGGFLALTALWKSWGQWRKCLRWLQQALPGIDVICHLTFIAFFIFGDIIQSRPCWKILPKEFFKGYFDIRYLDLIFALNT